MVEEPQPVDGGSSASIALVAPIWLQDALQVLLDGTSGVLLIGSATDVDTLLEMEEAPDFVLLDADRDSLVAVSEVERIIHAWPKTDCVALVDNPGQMPLLKQAGASLTLLKGASPQRLREVLQALAEQKLRR
ncbi:MAG: hypothetical protein O6949_01420 [Chloroflexi bacterium]|nr:hypothetical protein [Chloroflexota bacterium]